MTAELNVRRIKNVEGRVWWVCPDREKQAVLGDGWCHVILGFHGAPRPYEEEGKVNVAFNLETPAAVRQVVQGLLRLSEELLETASEFEGTKATDSLPNIPLINMLKEIDGVFEAEAAAIREGVPNG